MRTTVSTAAGAFVVAGAVAASLRVVRIKPNFPYVTIARTKRKVLPPRSAAVGAQLHTFSTLKWYALRSRLHIVTL